MAYMTGGLVTHDGKDERGEWQRRWRLIAWCCPKQSGDTFFDAPRLLFKF